MKRLVFLLLLLCCFTSAKAQNVSITCKPEVDSLIVRKVALNKQGIKVDGYSIQIYSGRLQKAREEQEAFIMHAPDYIVSVEYDNPDYKVFVGAYQTQGEANQALKEVRKIYSGAFVRPKQVIIYP